MLYDHAVWSAEYREFLAARVDGGIAMLTLANVEIVVWMIFVIVIPLLAAVVHDDCCYTRTFCETIALAKYENFKFSFALTLLMIYRIWYDAVVVAAAALKPSIDNICSPNLHYSYCR